jgi:two-component system, LytTR family, sensor kinase
MLVENAVKHNVIHANKPLIIEIRSGAANWLVVRNNLQRKTTRVISNRVGLSNIAAKYRLLFQHRPGLDPTTTGFTVTEANGCFTVTLCLLNPAAS